MRSPRQLEKDADYHITARINRKEFALENEVIKELLLQIIKEAKFKKKYKFQIKNFCIMSNHVHFILKPLKDESLSRIMQWILSVFAIRYNKRMDLTGHLWHDRFRSIIIYGIKHFFLTFVYISENPVRAKIVNSPEDFKYNGINYIIAKNFSIIEAPDEDILNYYFSIWKKSK